MQIRKDGLWEFPATPVLRSWQEVGAEVIAGDFYNDAQVRPRRPPAGGRRARAERSGGVLGGSRRFVALSAERMKQWMAADLSNLDLLID